MFWIYRSSPKREISDKRPVEQLTHSAKPRDNPEASSSRPTPLTNEISHRTEEYSGSRRAEAANSQSNAFYKAWQNSNVPLEFYGKVVDESGNAVPEASISLTWNKDDMTNPIHSGVNKSVTHSDSSGLFSLQSGRGRFLDIKVSKEGYYTPSPGSWSFPYSAETRVSAADPVIFALRKKGRGEAMVMMKRNYGVPRDGTPVAINLVTGNASNSENGDIIVKCWTQDAGKSPGEKYDWRCLITIPQGGLVLTIEEFAFIAPSSGYLPSTEIVMPADAPNWSSNVSFKFYYRLADGRYGRMTFSMVASGHHFCMIDSALNPGSSNLEPAN